MNEVTRGVGSRDLILDALTAVNTPRASCSTPLATLHNDAVVADFGQSNLCDVLLCVAVSVLLLLLLCVVCCVLGVEILDPPVPHSCAGPPCSGPPYARQPKISLFFPSRSHSRSFCLSLCCLLVVDVLGDSSPRPTNMLTESTETSHEGRSDLPSPSGGAPRASHSWRSDRTPLSRQLKQRWLLGPNP